MGKKIKPTEVVRQPNRHPKNITINNRSKRKISLQVKPPDGDFFLDEQQVHLAPGRTVTLPEEYVNLDQIKNLQSYGHLGVVSNG